MSCTTTQMLNAYKKAVKKIDDHFEYLNESKKDRIFVHNTLDNLTKELKEIQDNKTPCK